MELKFNFTSNTFTSIENHVDLHKFLHPNNVNRSNELEINIWSNYDLGYSLLCTLSTNLYLFIKKIKITFNNATNIFLDKFIKNIIPNLHELHINSSDVLYESLFLQLGIQIQLNQNLTHFGINLNPYIQIRNHQDSLFNKYIHLFMANHIQKLYLIKSLLQYEDDYIYYINKFLHSYSSNLSHIFIYHSNDFEKINNFISSHNLPIRNKNTLFSHYSIQHNVSLTNFNEDLNENLNEDNNQNTSTNLLLLGGVMNSVFQTFGNPNGNNIIIKISEI